jgi:hypothetical protein
MSVHLINLKAGGEDVLVTFAREGAEAQAFRPVVKGRFSRFTLAGNGRMTDSATGSTWDAMTGECLSGSMRGIRPLTRTNGRSKRHLTASCKGAFVHLI